MRSYRKGWQSDRPLKRYSRRAKWYEGDGSIRLSLSDGYYDMNHFFTDREEADAMYEAFIRGEINARGDKVVQTARGPKQVGKGYAIDDSGT